MTATNPSDTRSRVIELQEEIAAKRKQLQELRRAAPPERVTGQYTFAGPNGVRKTLGELFGDRRELIIIHNMGKGCRYCTLWADGFNGLAPHLENRAAFVVVSPDTPEVQQAFAASRGWRFAMWSAERQFLLDMKMADENGSAWPGVSTFARGEDGSIVRTGHDYFGPGDDFCSIWHILDLFPEGDGGWEPQYTYEE